jgi:hypothetical protein
MTYERLLQAQFKPSALSPSPVVRFWSQVMANRIFAFVFLAFLTGIALL